NHTRYKRYTVAFVQMKPYLVGDSQFMEKEVLLVDQNQENKPARAYLRQDWLHTNLREGDPIHICFTRGADRTTNAWIIDNDHNFLIQHPDHLISCTAVADSFFCLRKSVLQMTSKGISDFSEPLVHGAIIHETLQYCLQHKDFTTKTIKDTLQRIILDSLDSLYVIQQDEKKAYDLLETYVKSIQIFGSTYVGEFTKAAATVKKDMGPSTKDSECATVAIRDILDIEEHIWSPAYGLKGMIDATVEIMVSPSKKVFTLPFELKTGKASRTISHRAQTILYTLLLGDRYDIDIDTGVLYYSKTNSLYMVPALRSELRSLIMARNELALAYHRHSLELPSMIKDLHSCQYCSMGNACVIYHKAVEGGSAETSGLGQWFNDHTAHINDKAAAFYRHWIKLIAMEERDLDSLRRDIWNETAHKCELTGKCLKNMVVTVTRNDEMASNWYTFRRHEDDKDAMPLMHSNLIVGDAIVVSSMQGDLLLGNGFLTHIDSDSVTISLNMPLRPPPLKGPDFDKDTHQVFKKWWNQRQNLDIKYRLDKDEAAGGFSLMKSNLVALLTNDLSKPSIFDEIHAKLRRLIVDSKSPEFMTLDESPFARSLSDPMYAHLNSDQVGAIQKVITCQDYALILGMPGTGKTTTTADLIKFLIGHGKSVLLTAYTHNALDNILVKLVDAGVDVLRLGNPEKYADRFVLVGDQYQLPPIVKDKKANQAGFSTSLFATLAKNHPDAIAYLEYQYRMNKDIMTISSQLVYDNKLKCGNEKVATRTLEYPHLDEGLKSLHFDTNYDDDQTCRMTTECWLKEILDPR
ncbi:DNA replication factor Dna2-domain-containing protein, partial [Chlamydoabsidia padenii]